MHVLRRDRLALRFQTHVQRPLVLPGLCTPDKQGEVNMTDQHTERNCSCNAAQLVKLTLRGEKDLPSCPIHRPENDGSEPVALNDDTALAARLGMPLNKENI